MSKSKKAMNDVTKTNLDGLFKPESVVFLGGSNIEPALRFHKELGFSGSTWVVNPKYTELCGYQCIPSIADLPEVPDLAFIAIRAEIAVDSIRQLRDLGCKAVVCNAAGFAEVGSEGADLQSKLIEAIGDMAAIGPNSVGMVNYADPMAAMMDHFGVRKVDHGVAIVSQGGGLLCDAVFSDRGLPITHMIGCGNQARNNVADCMNYLLDDPRVRAVGLSFEGLPDVGALRKAAVKALKLGKPIVAIKFGKSSAGARAAASHTASMTGEGFAWDALFDRLGIISVNSTSEFFETLKLFNSGQIPKGNRVLVTSASGVMGVLLADNLSASGFEVPSPSSETTLKLRSLLPSFATPGNPQDVTMGVWNDVDRQRGIYHTLLGDDYDIAMMVQSYPREGMWDISEYEAQVEALSFACKNREICALQLSPLVDCFPQSARKHTEELGLAAMQGLHECIIALNSALWWTQRRTELLEAGVEQLIYSEVPVLSGQAVRLDEATAKEFIAAAGVPVPKYQVATPQNASTIAASLGFPVAMKALDARLLHKTEVGAVRIGLSSEAEVSEAITKMRVDMAEKVPDLPLTQVLVETMVTGIVAEVMASVSVDPATGPMLMVAGGGIEAELWKDTTLISFPVTRSEVERALDRLKITRRIDGYRGSAGGDRSGLGDALMSLVGFAESHSGALEEVEINPILVCHNNVVAVDAVLKLQV